MIISLVLTCLIAGFALSEVYAVTKPKIDQQRADATNSALSQVLPQARTYEMKEPDSLWYGLDETGSKIGIVVRSGVRGYGGPVPVLIGLDLSGKIVALKVASPSEGLKETPGLGLKATEQWFSDQFLGKDSTVALKKDGGTADAISGATITSRAVARGIAHAIRKYYTHLTPATP
jgi:Na+-translocating ferredoxin:NAD+ oxidoreductase subunit G